MTPYSRVYHSIIEDERFEGVYWNDAHLATWLRLLIAAEQAWPLPAHLPRVKRASLAMLSERGLIERIGDQMYRVHGLDAERRRRSDHASTAAAARWGGPQAMPPDAPSNAEGNAPSNAQLLLERERERVDVSSSAPAGDDAQPVIRWLYAKGIHVPANPASGLTRKLLDLVAVHGSERTIAALDQAKAVGNTDLRGLVLAAWDVLNPVRKVDPRVVAAQEAEERDRLRSRRAQANTKREIHNLGAHAAQPDRECPLCKP